jgi:hypothetical protein
MIRSGTINEIDHRQGVWAYLNIGFSGKETCGLVIGDGTPQELSYADATKTIVALAGIGLSSVSLVIQAPLSVGFDAYGNPSGRACELHDGQEGYWYVGAGAIVTIAAMYMMSRFDLAFKGKELVLYEGFISLKQRGGTHGGDAALLRETVVNRERHGARFIDPSTLKRAPTDTVRGAFEVMGIDSGIPPVIAIFG